MKRSLIALVCLLVIPAAFAGGPKKDKIHTAKNKINGQYIVVLEDRYSDVAAIADELSVKHHGKLKHLYDKALKGFAAEISDADASALADDPRVKYVEQDSVVS